MAAFCSKCGFPQSGSTAFCSNCGSRVSAAAGAPVPQPVMPLAQPASGSGLKIVMVILLCLFVAGIAAIGGLYYIGHRVKEAVIHKAAENGVDLSSITSPVSEAPASSHRKLRPACDYLSKEEASKMIGEPVERAVAVDAMCAYYGPPGLSATLARAKVKGAFQNVQNQHGSMNLSDLESVEQIARDMGLAHDSSTSETEMALLMIGVDHDGRAQMTAMTASNAIFGGIYKAAAADGVKFGGEVPNLGEKAVRLPKLGLNVLQGDTIIRVMPGPIPDAEKKSIDLARLLLGRI